MTDLAKKKCKPCEGGIPALTPAEAQAMIGLLDLRRRAIESVDLEARLAAIEARLTPQGGSQ